MIDIQCMLISLPLLPGHLLTYHILQIYCFCGENYKMWRPSYRPQKSKEVQVSGTPWVSGIQEYLKNHLLQTSGYLIRV